MHTDLIEKIIARRLRALADEPAEAPYDWAEFQRRNGDRPRISRSIGRNRLAAVALASAAAALLLGLAIASLTRNRTLVSAPATVARLDTGDSGATNTMRQARPDVMPPVRPDTTAQVRRDAMPQVRSDTVPHVERQPQARGQEPTRAVEVWLANLPRHHAMIRVGEHAAVSSLQDQIAALDDLMSAERVAGAQPSRLGVLERQRAQLVSSLAQLRYAEMLASATP